MKIAYKIRGPGSPPSKNLPGQSKLEEKYISKDYFEKVGRIQVQFNSNSQPKGTLNNNQEVISKPSSPTYQKKNTEAFPSSARIIFKQKTWKKDESSKPDEKAESPSENMKYKIFGSNKPGSPVVTNAKSRNNHDMFVESDPYNLGKPQRNLKFPRIDSDTNQAQKLNEASNQNRVREVGSRGLVVSRSANFKNVGLRSLQSGNETGTSSISISDLKRQNFNKNDASEKKSYPKNSVPLAEKRNQEYSLSELIPAKNNNAKGKGASKRNNEPYTDKSESESDMEPVILIDNKDKKKRLSDIGIEGRSIPATLQYLLEGREGIEKKPIEKTGTFERSESKYDEKEEKMIGSISFKSRAGATAGNVTKTNQDALVVINNFCGSKNKSFFAVCDGHGTNGHMVSGFVKNNLSKNVENIFREQRNSESPTHIKRAITEGFFNTHRQLLESNIECSFSGTTTVSLFMINRRVYCANVGDSRAILASCRRGEWTVKALSEDQKPDNPAEKARIIEAGGRVEQYTDFSGERLGPYRVWLKDENFPGLAMSRSIGDMVASQVGVIAEPVLTEFDLKDEDKFIIIASDGVWEFLSNIQTMNYVIPYFNKNNPEGAADKLIRESVILWKKEDEVIDDITCIVIFLNS